MAVLYVGAALVIIFMNFKLVPEAVSLIFTEAFTGTAIAGGFIGGILIYSRIKSLNQIVKDKTGAD